MLELFQSIQTWFIEFILGPGGYPALFFYQFLTNTIIPGSPEVAALAVWAAGIPIVGSIVVMTAGNLAGNILNYWVGYGGQHLVEKYFHIKKRRIERSRRWFEKYGPPVLLFTWVPIVGDPLTFVPGIVRYNFWKFCGYVAVGKIIRYVGLYYLVHGLV